MLPELPFCVTILSHNNIQNRRYLKVLQSILQQNYTNYHIVFVDDKSTDENMKLTMQYLESKKFKNVTYVQNIQRKYGTYNIINAAFRYCERNEIQMLVDGDDELIGRQVLKAMDRAYKLDRELALVYTNYKTNNYKYGDGEKFESESDISWVWLNKRKYIHQLSPIRSWKVQLIREIPMQAHMVEGKWLDTGYDDGLQYPLFEIAGKDRIMYLQEILYVANRQYGDNDDSTKQKKLHRKQLIWNLLDRKPYKVFKQFSIKSQKQLMNVLKNDEGTQYKRVYPL